MSEYTVCPRCSYEGPEDAHYCAHCGWAFEPARVRLGSSLNRTLSELSPLHLAILGLVLSILISAFVERLIISELSYQLSLLPIALIIGCGYAYLGWYSSSPRSNRSILVNMLSVFASMGVLLAAVWIVDTGLLSYLSDGSHTVVYEVPGVHVVSAPGFRRVSIGPEVPPYWLLTLIYGALAFGGGHLIQRARFSSRQYQH